MEISRSMDSATMPPLDGGNLCAFVLFVSPIPTFRRIIRNKSTEQFSGLPYIYSLFNCLICCWYGLPFISPNIILVATTNSFGAIFQFVYLAIFIAYTDRTNKDRLWELEIPGFRNQTIVHWVSECVLSHLHVCFPTFHHCAKWDRNSPRSGSAGTILLLPQPI
ncbi:Bidirectional sugar transporter SWEET2a [Linum grandiflorum]